MDERDEEGQAERPRPRIVDKRRTRTAAAGEPSGSDAAGAGGPTTEAEPPPTPQQASPAGAGEAPAGPSTAQPGAASAAAGPPPGATQVPPSAAGDAPPPPGAAQGPEPAGGPEERVWTPEEEAAAQQMARDLAERPSADWVLNIAVTLANVAGAKIQLGVVEDARLAIDTLEAIVNSVASQLEGAEAPLRQTLAQLQMAYAQAIKPPSP